MFIFKKFQGLEQQSADTSAYTFIILASGGDAVDNSTIQSVRDHIKLTAAMLEVESVAHQAGKTCGQISFDRTVISDGFELPVGWILDARTEIYAPTIGRRLSEKSTNG